MAALNFVNSKEAAIALGRFEGVGLVGNTQGRLVVFEAGVFLGGWVEVLKRKK